MIYDCELRMNEKDFKNDKHFPQYILLRRPVDKSLQVENNIILESLDALESKIQKSIQEEMNVMKQEMKSEMSEMKAALEKIIQKIDSK